MSMKVTKYITPLLAGTAAAVAIAAAPTASAADHQSCNGSGSGTVRQSRGNVQITAPGSGAWETGTASSWLASNVGGEGVAPLVAQVMDAKPLYRVLAG